MQNERVNMHKKNNQGVLHEDTGDQNNTLPIPVCVSCELED